MPLIDHLIYIIEQRIAHAVYLEKVKEQPVEQDLTDYSWYIRTGDNNFILYSVDCLQEVPISYTSKKGYTIQFTSEDTVHTAFLKIVKLEYETRIVNGTLFLKTRNLELDLTDY